MPCPRAVLGGLESGRDKRGVTSSRDGARDNQKAKYHMVQSVGTVRRRSRRSCPSESGLSSGRACPTASEPGLTSRSAVDKPYSPSRAAFPCRRFRMICHGRHERRRTSSKPSREMWLDGSSKRESASSQGRDPSSATLCLILFGGVGRVLPVSSSSALHFGRTLLTDTMHSRRPL